VAPERSGASLEMRVVLDHLAFLLSSAEISLHEPYYYGTMRLLDGASRFARAVLDAGVDDPRLAELSRRIDEAKAARKSDPDSYREFLHTLPAEVAEAIRALPPVARS
jgi:hypothetical protein